MMSVDIRRISVAFRELGDGNVWRVAESGGDPVRAAVMMLDSAEDVRPSSEARS